MVGEIESQPVPLQFRLILELGSYHVVRDPWEKSKIGQGQSASEGGDHEPCKA